MKNIYGVNVENVLLQLLLNHKQLKPISIMKTYVFSSITVLLLLMCSTFTWGQRTIRAKARTVTPVQVVEQPPASVVEPVYAPVVVPIVSQPSVKQVVDNSPIIYFITDYGIQSFETVGKVCNTFVKKGFLNEKTGQCLGSGFISTFPGLVPWDYINFDNTQLNQLRDRCNGDKLKGPTKVQEIYVKEGYGIKIVSEIGLGDLNITELTYSTKKGENPLKKFYTFDCADVIYFEILKL
jgi:hypothetical protein